MHNVKELKICNKSMDLAVQVYELSAKFPSNERFGLTSQTRRCAVSIPSNISEGAGRNTKGEFKQFTRMSFPAVKPCSKNGMCAAPAVNMRNCIGFFLILPA